MPEASSRTAFDERVTRVQQLARSGETPQALTLARALLPEADEIGSRSEPLLADALNRLGMFFFHQSFNDEALAAYHPALAMMQRLASDDAASHANLHNNIGQALSRLGRDGEAVPHLERALKLNVQHGASPEQIAIAQDNLGLALSSAGQAARAVPLHEEALLTFEQLHGPINAHAATTLGNLGSAHHRLGERRRALACDLRSLDMHLAVDGPGGQGALVSAANVIQLALTLNDVALAGELCDVVLALAENDPASAGHNTAVMLLQVAQHAFNAFALGLADRLCRAAQDLLRRTEGGDTPAALHALRLAAQVALAKGNESQAEPMQLRLLATPGRSLSEQARDWIEHGKNLRGRSDAGARESIGHFQRALALLRREPEADAGDIASALGNLAEAHFRTGQLGEAHERFAEALHTLGPKGAQEDRAWLQHAHGLLHFRAARHSAAAACLREAVRLWTRLRGAHHPFVATANANLALVLWDGGDAPAAARLLARAERLRAPELARRLAVGADRERLETARDSIGDLYRAVSFHFATGAGEPLATRLLLQFKGAVQLAMMRSQARLRQRLTPAAGAQLNRLAALQQQITALVAAEQLHEGQTDPQALAPLQAEAAELQRALGHRSAHGQSALAAVALADVRSALPPGALLLEYLRWAVYAPRTIGPVGFRYAAVLLGRRGRPRWFDLGEAGAIDAAVQALRRALHEPESAGLADAEHRLTQHILAPVALALAAAQHVVVAPDAALNLVPFAGLLEPLLPADALVHQVASGAELIDDGNTTAQGVPVALVDPDFGADDAAAGGYEALPGTREEGQLLQRLWPATQVMEGTAASVDALRQLRQPALLHIATHGHFLAPEGDRPLVQHTSFVTDEGVFLVQSPSRSARDDAMLHGGLALAGANRGSAERTTGIVSAAELAQLDLRGTALVVLSACDTGIGSIGQAEEFAGLRRAFAIAGARSQLTSLWAVDDDATAALMTHFYAALRTGRSRAVALREAQRAVRAWPSWSHPFYWAAFVLWGEHGPLPGHLLQEAT